MHTARRFWTFGVGTPLIYLIICIIINRAVFSMRATPGFWPMSERTFGWIFIAAAVLAMVTMPLLYILKSRWALRCPPEEKPDATEPNNGRDEEEENQALFSNRCARRFMVLFMISDSVGFCGLILFLLQGWLGPMLFFGIVSFLDYAISYPGGVQESSGV